MRRAHVLLGGAAFFAAISSWSVWLGVVSDGRWAVLAVFSLIATFILIAVAASEAAP